MLPGEVDLTALESMNGGVREGVVVVVPTFAKSKSCYPRVVAGVVTAVEGHSPPAVTGGIDQPGDVINDR